MFYVLQISFTNLVSVDERLVYKPHPHEPDKWVLLPSETARGRADFGSVNCLGLPYRGWCSGVCVTSVVLPWLKRDDILSLQLHCFCRALLGMWTFGTVEPSSDQLFREFCCVLHVAEHICMSSVTSCEFWSLHQPKHKTAHCTFICLYFIILENINLSI